MKSDEKPPGIDYGRRPNDRFERNGWIGLAVTLAVCIIWFLIYISR